MQHRTTDAQLAAFLTAKGYPLVGIEPTRGSQRTFVIEAPEEASRGFYDGVDDQVSAKQLFDRYYALLKQLPRTTTEDRSHAQAHKARVS